MSHEHHQKEWHLQHIILDETEAINKLIIPSCTLKVDEEG
jgi:hypothetical protein